MERKKGASIVLVIGVLTILLLLTQRLALVISTETKTLSKKEEKLANIEADRVIASGRLEKLINEKKEALELDGSGSNYIRYKLTTKDLGNIYYYISRKEEGYKRITIGMGREFKKRINFPEKGIEVLIEGKRYLVLKGEEYEVVNLELI